MSTQTRTPEEIERQIEEDRARLTDTLETLQDRFSIDTIVEQLKGYALENGGRFGTSAARVARDNPIAVALTGIGASWLAVAASGAGRASLPARSEVHPDRDALTETDADIEAGFRRVPVYDPTKSRASVLSRQDYDLPPRQPGADHLGAGRSRVTSAEYDLDAGTEDLDDEGRSRVRMARQKAIEARGAASDYISDKASDLSGLIARQPLLVGAAVLALGAAVGSRMPGTRTENRLMGEQSDRLFVEAERIFEEERARARLHAEALKADAKAATHVDD